MDIMRKASHILVCGKSGMGKSTYGLRYIIASHHDRIFIFDHQSEYSLRLKLEPVYTFEEMRKKAATDRIVIFDFTLNYPGQLAESFDEFNNEVFDMARNYLEPQNIETLYVCDELGKIVPVQDAPMSLKTIYQTGRRYKLDSLTLSQQPNRLHNEVREQITELTLFRLDDENSLKFVKNMGKDTEIIKELEPLHYRWYNCLTGEERKSEIKYTK